MALIILMSLVNAKAFAKRIHDKLVPIEEDVYKFEDVVLCLKKVKSITLYVSINILFLLVFLLHLPPMTLVFLIIGLCSLSPYYKPVVDKIFRRFILGKKVKVLPENAPRKRYDIAQLSAFFGTCYYIIEGRVQSAREGLQQKNIMTMGLTFFGLNFIFYLFLSFPGALVMWLFMNLVLLLPLLIQLRFNKVAKKIQEFRRRMMEERKKQEAANSSEEQKPVQEENNQPAEENNQPAEEKPVQEENNQPAEENNQPAEEKPVQEENIQPAEGENINQE